MFGLTTQGGTEYVARVTRDALAGLNWSTERDALKIIFVCGNEPADQDKEILLKNVAQTACLQGVIVNTIYCGNINDADARSWRQFATLAEGRFATIDQTRNRRHGDASRQGAHRSEHEAERNLPLLRQGW